MPFCYLEAFYSLAGGLFNRVCAAPGCGNDELRKLASRRGIDTESKPIPMASRFKVRERNNSGNCEFKNVCLRWSSSSLVLWLSIDAPAAGLARARDSLTWSGLWRPPTTGAPSAKILWLPPPCTIAREVVSMCPIQCPLSCGLKKFRQKSAFGSCNGSCFHSCTL